MNFKPGKLFVACLLIFSLAFLASGCSIVSDLVAGRKRMPDTSQEGMYKSAMRLLEKKKYEKAAEAFKKFKEEYPLSEYTPLAELRTADCLFYNKSYAEAVILYEEFKKLHPLHPEVAYANYQLAMCHFKQLPTLDRDQSETQKAIEQFRYVIATYPQSPHNAEAKGKMEICLKQLAEHDFYIAHFYFRTKCYKAALGRLEEILVKYPEAGFKGKIAPMITKCRAEILKEEAKKKEKEAKAEKKKKAKEAREEQKKAQEDKKKAQTAGTPAAAPSSAN